MSSPETHKNSLKGDKKILEEVNHEVGEVVSDIYIEPEKEAAVLRKFDKFVLPVSVVFLVLSSLDQNNVSKASVRSNSILSNIY